MSGPITNSITPQYKTGMLGVNSTTIPVNALEIGGGGNAYIGGSINATSGTVTGVLTSGKVQIVDVVVENAACTPNGLVAKDSTGILLSCQGPPRSTLKWKKASGAGDSCMVPGIPDVIRCKDTGSIDADYFPNLHAILDATKGNRIEYCEINGSCIVFNPDKTFYSGVGQLVNTACFGQSIAQLTNDGNAWCK